MAKALFSQPEFSRCPFEALLFNAKQKSSRQLFAFSILEIINILKLPAPWFINIHFLLATVKGKLYI